MPKTSPNERRNLDSMSTKPTLTWQVLKKHPAQLIAASALLVIWIVFLVAMAAYN